jgi:hypothetical protein
MLLSIKHNSEEAFLVTRMQGKNLNIKIANISFENVAKFIYLETKITNKIYYS